MTSTLRATLALAAAGVLGAIAAAGCKAAPSGGAPSTAASAGAPANEGRVRVAPDLVASGRVGVVAAERRAPEARLRFAGEVLATPGTDAEAGVLASGRVASLEVREGQRVEKGATLALVDVPEVARVASEVLRAKARAEAAKRRLERQLSLEKDQATSGAAVDEARADARVAEADLFAARTLLSSLGGTEPAAGDGSARPLRVAVRAPIAGVVAHVGVTLGAPVSPDRSLFRVVGENTRIVRALVPETQRPLLDAEHGVSIVARAIDETGVRPSCDATVRGDTATVDDATRAIALRVEPTGACPFLVAGGFVDVVAGRRGALAGGEAGLALVVPGDAVVDVRGRPTVFVAVPNEAASFDARGVRLGPTLGADVVVEAGLAEGERVALRGALLLKGELLRADLMGN